MEISGQKPPISEAYLHEWSSGGLSYEDLQLLRQPLADVVGRGELDQLLSLLARIGRAEGAAAWKRDARRVLAELLAATEVDASFRWSIPSGDGIPFECECCGRPDEIQRAPRSGRSSRLRWVRWEEDRHRPFVVCATCGKRPKPFSRCDYPDCESLAEPRNLRCRRHLAAEPPIDPREEAHELVEPLVEELYAVADRWRHAPHAEAAERWETFDQLANRWLEQQLGLEFDAEARATQLALAEVKLTRLSALPFEARVAALQRGPDTDPRWARLRALHGLAEEPNLLVRVGNLDTSGDEI